MIHLLQNTKLLKLFWGLLALFMLNSSIDLPDITSAGLPEDLSYNEQESIAEYILEEILNIENAIPESEDNDATQNSTIKKTAVADQYIIVHISLKENIYPVDLEKEYPQNGDFFLANQFIEIVSPPPEV